MERRRTLEDAPAKAALATSTPSSLQRTQCDHNVSQRWSGRSIVRQEVEMQSEKAAEVNR